MTRLQKAATIIALALCFAGAIGMEVWQASNAVHVAVNQDTAKNKEHATDTDSPKESAEEAIARYNKWLTIFTAILAISTVGLGFATVGLYFVSQRQLRHAEIESRRARAWRLRDQGRIVEQFEIARKNADAAKDSADAAVRQAKIAETSLTQLERPYIFIWGIRSSIPSMLFTSTTGPNDVPKLVRDSAHFNYSVSNGGKLAGVIETVSIACGYERNGRPPPLRIIGDHYLLGTPIVSSGQNVLDIPYKIPLAELDRADPSPYFRDDLIFRVVIEYRGPVTRDHETSQCWRYRNAVNGWAEDPRYTYSRQRNKGGGA